MFENLPDVTLLALLIYGEARGEKEAGRRAVGHVVLNRLYKSKRYGATLPAVILKKWQFSCFNQGDPNRAKLEKLAVDPEGEIYDQCLCVAANLLAGKDEDNTKGATHYFNPAVVKPAWARKMKHTVTIGNHEFYRE